MAGMSKVIPDKDYTHQPGFGSAQPSISQLVERSHWRSLP